MRQAKKCIKAIGSAWQVMQAAKVSRISNEEPYMLFRVQKALEMTSKWTKRESEGENGDLGYGKWGEEGPCHVNNGDQAWVRLNQWSKIVCAQI